MAYPAELFLKHPNKEPNLFQCEKDGKSFLLFGTYHVMPLSVIPEAYLEIMRKADKLVLESLHKPRSEASLIQAGFIYDKDQDERTYEKLTPVAREILLNVLKLFCARHQLPNFPLTRVVLERAIWLARFCTNYGGMDSTLEKSGFKFAYGLEESESIDFDTTTIDELNNSLEEGFGCLRNPPSYPEEILSGMDEYLAGDSLLNPGYCYRQEQEESMVVSRNRKWMPEILRHHATEGTALIAVGHTHLVGTSGLLCLLQQNGFKISQYSGAGKIFETFMPDFLFKPFAENYAIAKRIETVMDAVLDSGVRSVLFSDKSDNRLESDSNKISKFNLTYPTLSEVQGTVYGLVMEYWEPVSPVLFSKIYPTRKADLESGLNGEVGLEKTVGL